MNLSRLLSLFLVFALASAADTSSRVGDVLWSNHLDSLADLQTGSGGGELTPEPGRNNVLVITNGDPAQTVVRTFTLPTEILRGRFVFLGAEVKSENVSAKPKSWNGIKLMARIDTPDGPQWPQAEMPTGSFGWQRFSKRMFVPQNASAVTLVLGLEQVSGRVEFDEVRFTLARNFATVPEAPLSQPIFRGHSLPRLRGAMVAPSSLTDKDLAILAQNWGANLVRWQLIRNRVPPNETGYTAYDQWLARELALLDRGLDWAGKLGVKVVVDLHSPPGGKPAPSGYQAAIGSLWTDPGAQAKFIEVWRKIAGRYQGDSRIWGYDLVNEPDDSNLAEGCDDWQSLAERAGRAVREIDPRCTLIIEPASWGSSQGFVGFQPIPLTNTVYSFHMYIPSEFTHQGVFGPSEPITYPGRIAGAIWNKAALEKSMGPAIDFARRYRVHLYVGEFSAIRWAPGGEQYLDDVINIFEAHGWDWTYHAFREWDGWSVEHGSDKNEHQPVVEPPARQKVLLKWFRRGN
jgi:endoglucanase